MTKNIPLCRFRQHNGVVIDTRDSALYNGWPDALHGSSGHVPGARNLAASWLEEMTDAQFASWSALRPVSAETSIALYGAPQDNDAVEAWLSQKGLHAPWRINDAFSSSFTLKRLPGFHHLVPAGWLNALLTHRQVSEHPVGKWILIEAGWGERDMFRRGHIPGADYLDTEELESEPLWNVVPPETLCDVLTTHGICCDTTVILYSRTPLAAARVAHILLYAGVQDVRLLDGGWQAWLRAGFPVVSGDTLSITPARDFGAPIPAQPQLMLSLAQTQALLNRQDASVVSIRSWAEYSGATSGYAYIDASGDIPGARWGRGGSGKDGVEDFLNPDETLRCADYITAMWEAWNITADQQIAFYCGTGWRASLAFICARAMGWKNIGVYDGGWYEWSLHHNNG
ncbi:rhodanese-like domain-containing protein [Escherichia coli]|nr:rhodanese-like domain-containing protein [Escherichia coli]